MNTQEKEFLVSRYNDPDLTADEKAQISELMQQDADIADWLKQYQNLDQQLGQLSGKVDLGGIDFDRFAARIQEGIQDHKETVPHSGRKLHWHRIIPLAAAAMIVLAFSVLVSLQFSQQSTSMVTVIGPTKDLGKTVSTVVTITGPQIANEELSVRSAVTISEPTKYSKAELMELFPSTLQNTDEVLWCSSFGGESDENETTKKNSENGPLILF
jgi:anti-sigma-K factor RskA